MRRFIFYLQILYRGPSCEKVKLIGATCPDLEILHLGSDDAKRLNFKVCEYLSFLLSLPPPTFVHKNFVFPAFGKIT